MSADVKVKLQTTNKTTPIHVLHVDDDSFILEISKQILIDLDSSFEFDCACCVDEGFMKLSNGHYDVVVCDYEMPQKDGLQFLKELREKNIKTPFILFTGKGREEVAIKALNLGANGYYNKQGSPETVYGELCYGIIQTVERKRAEEALRKSEHLNQKILKSTPNLIYIYDIAEKRNVYANHEIIDFLGYTQKQIITMGSDLFSNILHPDDAKAVAEHHARFINAPNNVVYDIEYRMKHARGEWRFFHSRDTLFTRTKEGTGKQILGICEDVTQHRQIEYALKASEEKYRAYVENSPVAFFVVTSEGRYQQVNDAACSLLGYSRDELLAMNIVDVLFKKDVSLGLKQFGLLKEKGKILFEVALKRKDGFPVYVILNAAKLPEGKMMAFCENITELKKTEEELRGIFEVLERVGESIDVGLAVIGRDYRVVWANKQLMALGVIPNKKCYYTFNQTKTVCTDCGSKKIFDQKTSLDIHEYKTVNSKGELIWVELRVTPLKDKNGNLTAALELAVPITERKKTEQALIDSRNKYESLFLNSLDGIIVAKRDGKIISVNPAICRMLGMSEQELLKSCRQEIVVNDQKNDLALKENDENGKVAAQLSFRRKDNSLLEVEISSRTFLDTDGSTSILISVRDISDRIMHEEKLRTVGSFTRHDIRNKLSTAFGQTYLSKKLVINQPELTKRLDQIESSLSSIKGILDFAKEYESIGYQKLRQIDVGKTIDDAYSLFGDIKGISLVNKVCESTVLADRMLTTLFYNLIDNTVKHGVKADSIEVYIQKNKDDSESIVYQDNGVGISTKDKVKLFEAGIGDGKGFGLFLIKKTCEFYGWTITEEGEPGKGARFNITIPKSNFVNKKTADFKENLIPKVTSKGDQH